MDIAFHQINVNVKKIGDKCDVTTCFGILGNDSNACNGRGICSDFNACSCETGWEGNNCTTPQCYGKSAHDESVCSGKGKCVGKDQCKCDKWYIGKECTKNRVLIVYAQSSIPSWSWLCVVIVILLFV